MSIFKATCAECNGSGRINGGQHFCGKCGGKGYVFTTKPPAQQKQEQIKRQEDAVMQMDEFEALNPDIAAWWKDNDFEFARSLREQCRARGGLTPRQMEAARNCIARDRLRREERAQRQWQTEQQEQHAPKPAVDVSVIEQAFNLAMSNQVKTPLLRLGEFVFKRAPDHGRNPGAIYVTADKVYLGMIKGGVFARKAPCTDEQEQAIVDAASHPKEAAIAYGKREGRCSVCGRRLDNHESIDRGIGPICAEKFGW